jgi:hypothetical protein
MATTMKLIAKQTLGSNAADVTFSSIPGTYTDLLIVFTARCTVSNIGIADNVRVRFNGATSDTNHSSRWLYGSGSSTASGTDTFARAGYSNTASNTANTFASSEMYLPNYAGSAAKSFSVFGVTETNAAAVDMVVSAGLWNSTSAVTSMRLYTGSGTDLVTGSSFFLYGITKA